MVSQTHDRGPTGVPRESPSAKTVADEALEIANMANASAAEAKTMLKKKF